MGKYASKVIELAKNWIGKKESDGTHKSIIDIYNAHKPLARSYKVKYTDAWCATFVSAVSIKLGYTDIIPTECGCEEMIKKFKKLGVWIENENRTPKPGEIIFYDWQDDGKGDNVGYSDHVGIVEKVDGKNITIIEGNINDTVGRRVIVVNEKGIRGYAAPKYDAEVVKTESVKSAVDVEEVAKEVIAGKWGNGVERKNKLIAAGYDYDAVQNAVNRLVRGVDLKKGDKVKVLKNINYDNGKPFKVWHSTYEVMQTSGKRVVIGVNGVVAAPVNVENLKKV